MATVTSINPSKIAYHRNGVCGAGFYAVDFTTDIEGRIIAFRGIVFPHESNGDAAPEYYTVTSEDPSDCWRGDYFIDALCKAINASQSDFVPFPSAAASEG